MFTFYIVLCIVIKLGALLAYPAASNVNELETAPLSLKEERCLEKGQFYSNLTGQDRCYELLGTGPCRQNERFVLRNEQPQDTLPVLKAICAKNKCGEGKYWPETDSCVTLADKLRLCGDSSKVMLADNVFGEGECTCIKVPPHARLGDDPSNECFELYQRGPCKSGQILAVPSNSNTPVCMTDPCHKVTLALRMEEPLKRRTAVYYKDGCYELEKSGDPCPNNHTLKISLLLRSPKCIQPTQAIFDFDVSEECEKDEMGQCLPSVHLSDDYFKVTYKENVIATLQSSRRHHHTAIQGHNGTQLENIQHSVNTNYKRSEKLQNEHE